MWKLLVSRGVYLGTDVRYIQTSQPNSDNLIQYIVFNYFPIDLVIGNSIIFPGGLPNN